MQHSSEISDGKAKIDLNLMIKLAMTSSEVIKTLRSN